MENWFLNNCMENFSQKNNSMETRQFGITSTLRITIIPAGNEASPTISSLTNTSTNEFQRRLHLILHTERKIIGEACNGRRGGGASVISTRVA